jgi:hypothetical protein
MDGFQPSLIEAGELCRQCPLKDSLLPICISTPCDLQSPCAVFLKLSAGYVFRNVEIRMLIQIELQPNTHFFSRVRQEHPKLLAGTAT